eukprot:scaffold5185_cov23-Tisochrysis_lutea.AAC.2
MHLRAGVQHRGQSPLSYRHHRGVLCKPVHGQDVRLTLLATHARISTQVYSIEDSPLRCAPDTACDTCMHLRA